MPNWAEQVTAIRDPRTPAPSASSAPIGAAYYVGRQVEEARIGREAEIATISSAAGATARWSRRAASSLPMAHPMRSAP